ncbi:hypothetical protein H257_00117 [Aphanomyces astaci]|uniref:Pre-rRNA-processing protein TSR2 homolog n=1 Tax=Aphanomyces astaci TaxID=112090 RepID=W4H961_APHAT|nr:hypothetical protein H257_00117 [Aphanomyces astaci]ETV88550.1 hypothetical protein H257_00117 [Aphanomyces astaci]RQM24435.1 hypothetical protein B5M09_002598 [Aphanomyces astaci]|eukprot:XP_009820950.1 hypothetical protein H257_00117 [Aphanomyces astaci]
MSTILNSIVAAHAKTPGNQWEYFEFSVKLTMARWTALRMAMEGEWGGGDMRRKFEILLDDVLNWFKYQKSVEYDDLAAGIEEYIESEFALVCEDDSVDEVAKLLLTLAAECKQGDFSRVRALEEQFQTSTFAIDLKKAKLREEQALLRRAEQQDENQDMDTADEPLVDDDGFQTVRRSTRKKTQPKFFDPQVEFPGAN